MGAVTSLFVRGLNHLHNFVPLLLVSGADVEGEDLIEVVVFKVVVGTEAEVFLEGIDG